MTEKLLTGTLSLNTTNQIISTAILSLPLADSSMAVVSYWRKDVHIVLVNRLGAQEKCGQLQVNTNVVAILTSCDYIHIHKCLHYTCIELSILFTNKSNASIATIYEFTDKLTVST